MPRGRPMSIRFLGLQEKDAHPLPRWCSRPCAMSQPVHKGLEVDPALRTSQLGAGPGRAAGQACAGGSTWRPVTAALVLR